MVAMDAGFLSMLLHPDAKPPNDPVTGKPLSQARERIEQLVEDLYAANDRVTIGTPALAEFLVLAGRDGPQYLAELGNQPGFYIRPFDQMAAVELASMELLARAQGDKRYPADTASPWQKIKVDRQIVAIAKVNQAHTMYSDDNDVRVLAEASHIKVKSSWELPEPPNDMPLFAVPSSTS